MNVDTCCVRRSCTSYARDVPAGEDGEVALDVVDRVVDVDVFERERHHDAGEGRGPLDELGEDELVFGLVVLVQHLRVTAKASAKRPAPT